jgi:hypothetical protein
MTTVNLYVCSQTAKKVELKKLANIEFMRTEEKKIEKEGE